MNATLKRKRLRGWGPLASGLLLLAGCQRSDAVTRYDVAGTVTFAGKAVPAGIILFTPDAAKNNRGPAGFAKVKDGKYDTRLEGKGTVGGPQIVVITGFDGSPPDEEGLLPDGKPLFSDFTTSVDLPKEETTHDFQIPGKRRK
jgi:hypothetical protein